MKTPATVAVAILAATLLTMVVAVECARVRPQDRDTNRPANLTGNAADDWDPVWSLGGGMIAFTSDRTGDDEIWRVRADGADPTNLTTSPNSRDLQPAWQPLP